MNWPFPKPPQRTATPTAPERAEGLGARAARPERRAAITAAARIHAELRDRIVSFALPPGASLSEPEIAAAFGVSRTPVREALLRLAEEELVDIYPQSGTFVARLSASVAQDAMVIRKALERIIVREAAERATPADIVELDAILARQRVAAEFNDIEGFHAADEAMHECVATIAGRPKSGGSSSARRRTSTACGS